MGTTHHGHSGLALAFLTAMLAGCMSKPVGVVDLDEEGRERNLEADLVAAVESKDFFLKVAANTAHISTDTAIASLNSASQSQARVQQITRELDDSKVRTKADKDAIRDPYLAHFTCPSFLQCGLDYIYDSGHFDVGVGFGGAVDILPDNGSDDDILGGTIVLKAYPLGRWWAAVPESEKPDAVLEVIEDDFGASLFRRLNFFVGVSIANFSPDDDRQPDLHGPMYIAGIAYDFAPQFALAAGLAFVEVERPRGSSKDRDTEVALYVGLLLNAEAIMAMFDKQLTSTLKTRAFNFEDRRGAQ